MRKTIFNLSRFFGSEWGDEMFQTTHATGPMGHAQC